MDVIRNFSPLILAVALFAGCGSGESADVRLKAMYKGDLKTVVPVGGSVTVDGQPGTDVVAYLHSSKGGLPINTSLTDEEGNFSWSTYVPGDGLPPGDYKVTFKRFVNARKEKGDDLLKGRYSNPMSSKFELKVKEDEGEMTADYALTTK